ncbi:PREDICTED: histone-lysine N-methyltransferase, H3 lysine-79 specific-like [Amphimedon queenslandica]|uniref:Uncharacterized protein n=1 Tax=Amphimedon queenslandica TaxID=400682 RepID=A0A1X7T7F1_AMPQE|nr:PREDICTED: histone-lysine N-methyltransferase, H3 lysine-79 specific-like [Amphimedon queenslandica]|eukprot:XP_019861027.1 PREDICTED: histone-lysine N-methyltransferase, H3 lysine-79 specific-like [Amphimedon queenslandica]
MRSSSNLIDIEMLQGLTEHLQLPEGREIISEYQEDMMKYASSLPVQLCTAESLNTILMPPPLKCESATFAFKWDPEQKKLKDAVDIVSKSTGKLMKVYNLEMSGDEVHVNCVFLYTLMGAAIATVHDNIEALISDGIVKVTIGYLTVWKKQVHDILTKEREEPQPSEATQEEGQDTSSASLDDEDRPKTTAELEDIVEKLSDTLKDKEQEVEELADILQKIKEGTPLERKVSELKLYLKQEREKEKSLRDEIKEMEEALKDPEAYEKKRLTNELERLKREKKQKEDKLLEDGKKEISVLKEKLKELEKELAEKEEENKSLTENLKALQSQLTETKASEADDPPQPIEEPTIPTSPS